MPFKDEVNLQQCSLIFRHIRNEDDCPDYITKLLTRNSDLRSDNRASRWGGLIWYVLFIIEKRKRGVLLTFVELRYGRHLDLRKMDTAGSFKNVVLKSIF